MKEEYEIFLKEKPVRALITIANKDNICSSDVSKCINTTYSHTVKIVKQLQEKGLVKKTEQKGRKKFLKTTEQGEKYKENFENVLDLDEGDIEKPTLSGKY